MSPAVVLLCSITFAIITGIQCCPHAIHDLESNSSFHIIEESKIGSDHKIIINEHICMERRTCFNREYTVLLRNELFPQYWKGTGHQNCQLEFPITMSHIKIEKLELNSSLHPVFIELIPPQILRSRLKGLSIAADLDKSIIAGFWTLNHTCWMKNNRSLMKCGQELFLRRELVNQSISLIKLESWILEPIETLGGIMKSLYIHFNPNFFFQGVQTLLEKCCYTDIHLQGTRYGNTTIRNQTQLKTLFVKYTESRNLDVDLESMPQLLSLSLPETTMAYLPRDLIYLKNLEVLDVSDNNLTSLPSHLLTSTQLKVLNVSHNNLKILPFTMSQLTNLLVLNVSNNKITDQNLSTISQLEKLEVLDLSHNIIKDVPKELSGMKKLRVLDLNYNNNLAAFRFFNTSELFVSLEVLKLSHTGYVISDGNDILQKVNSLRYLDLSGNERFSWADKPFEFLIGKENMTYLNMSGVDMNRTGCLGISLPGEYSKLAPLLNLKVLDLSHCNIETLSVFTFQQFPALEQLDLSFNKLKSIPSNLTYVLPQIKTLDLSQNQLSSIHFHLSFNNTMDILDLSHNRIVIPEKIIYSGDVRNLDLSYNIISEWKNPNIFTSSVRVVDLSYNEIGFINENMRLSFRVLQGVILEGNRIDCQNCTTIEIQNWLNVSRPKNIFKLTCAWPSDKKGKDVASVHVDQLTCNKDPKNGGLLVILPITFVVTSIVLLVGLVFLFKYRLQIAYMLHAYGMKRRYKKKQDNIEKEYDAFVCYSNLDSTWVCDELSPNFEKEPENYKFCIHDRDFPVGTFIMKNIHTAIKSSQHTIIVLSNNFLNSTWCRWELELTNYTMVHEHRDLIIMVELESLDKSKIPDFLKFLMNTQTYLRWPRKNPDQASKDFALRRLRLALGKSLCQLRQENASTA